MNGRIKELAKQANVIANTAFIPDSDWATYRDLKFAELIVQECMEVCRRGKYDGRDDMSLIQFNSGIRFCMNAIDNHFGD